MLQICRKLGSPQLSTPQEVPLIEERYAGPGDAIPSAASMGAIRQPASLEGLLLGPIYTAKAFAGLFDLDERGKIASELPLILLQSGGLPGMFAYDDNQYRA